MRAGALAASGAVRPWGSREAVCLGVVIAGALVLYLPFFRVVTWFGDEGILPHGAERILRGDRLYSDFFEFLPPGGYLLTAAWFQLTGISFGAVRSLQLLLFTGTCVLTYLACLKVSRRTAASAIAVLLWAVMSVNSYFENSHHWFTSVLCMGVLLALLHWTERPERLWLAVLAGLLGGAAAMVTPTRGALALLAGLVAFTDIRRDWRALVAYCAASLVVPVILIGYVTALGSLHDAVQSVIVFPATRYAAIQFRPYGLDAREHNFPLVLAFPLAFLLLAVLAIRTRGGALRAGAIRLCAAFAVAAFLGIQTRPDVDYIARVVPFALPLLLLVIPFGTLLKRPATRVIITTSILSLGVLPTLVAVALANFIAEKPATESPRGPFRLIGRGAADHAAVAAIARLAPDERIFVYPYAPMLPFMAGRVQSAPLNILIPSYTTAQQYWSTCRAVLRDADWAVVHRRWTTQSWLNDYPSTPDAEPRERMAFEAVLDQAFRPGERYGLIELRPRDPAVPLDVCEPIRR